MPQISRIFCATLPTSIQIRKVLLDLPTVLMLREIFPDIFPAGALPTVLVPRLPPPGGNKKETIQPANHVNALSHYFY